ncbi:MAG: DUF1553 domain-containing protein [Fuerstiella sp.]|nr:DUF1553 domain-containing protein [Fuerstiella sp.]MCP4507076.1 DUF1553 domain-containing protein [Fuerstiella sp.]
MIRIVPRLPRLERITIQSSVIQYISVVFCLTAVSPEPTAAFGSEDTNSFSKVQTLLEHRCLSCHNGVDRKGDFSLQTGSALKDSGYLVAGNAGESHLLSVLQSVDGKPPSMPKGGEALSTEEIRLVSDWINKGAAWPDAVVLQQPAVSNFDWWSFKPVQRPEVPTVSAETSDPEWQQSPIDAFVLARHRELGLTHTPTADRRTLIRRLTYDLTGLPPTPEQVTAFVANDDPQAYSELVERLLASLRYGERWARHWLDVVKYADTCGYDKDKLRPNAWPYRDYVIRSFNEDKPYSRFVQEQIAGDALFPNEPDGILGLGFVAAGPWDFIGHVEVPESKIDGMVARNLDRDEMVTNTLNTFCSVTIQCARCHNHKFDPFTQEHYYSLQSIFAAVDRAERRYDTDPETERRRRELSEARDEVAAQLKKFDDDVKQEGGTQLAALDKRIAKLKPKAQPADKRPEFGYHSQTSGTQNSEKWVEVDLGEDVEIASIVLHPCHDDFGGIGAGFGFPLRFRVDVRPDAGTADASGQSDTSAPATPATELQQFITKDFPNPGLASVEISGSSTTARFVRVTALKLADRKGVFIFALAELAILDSNGNNVATGAKVTALDSIEAPSRWRKSNLTDGIWASAADPAVVAKLSAAEKQRTEILNSILTPDRVASHQEMLKRRSDLDERLKKLPTGRMVYAAATHFNPQGNFKPTNGTPRSVSVLHRGNIQQPQATVRPGVIPLTNDSIWNFDLPDGHSEADRRAALAHWITSPENPLTWRSIANRVWQYHFGKGIVDSPNDLGQMGRRPTHPELLDWLADEFRRTQSFKHLHRLIVNSATYRQASTRDEANALIDSDNQYLWRMNRRRLSAEELRDSVLSVSGKLDLKMGGPGFYLFALEKTAHSPHFEYHKFDPDDTASHRRSVYRFIARSQPDPFMTMLDCADSSQSTPRRTETLTSLQALSLLNNNFNLAMARHFANRVESESKGTSASTRAFELVTGRPPTVSERERLDSYRRQFGLANLCRVLFNTSEFVYLD